MYDWGSRAEIGRMIREIREALGMTQGEFAHALGIPGSQSQVSLWERGRVMPVTDTLHAVAELGGGSIGMFTKHELREASFVAMESSEPYGSDEDAVYALVVDPNLARRVVGKVAPEERKTRLAIIHEFEGAFVEAGHEIPPWLEDLRKEVLSNGA